MLPVWVIKFGRKQKKVKKQGLKPCFFLVFLVSFVMRVCTICAHISPGGETVHPFIEHVNPALGSLLKSLNMDKTFVRGEGSWLYDKEGKRYLDMVASYGALPFGYNPPRVWEALKEVEKNCEPSLVQPSFLEAAGELARRLVELAPAGIENVTFTNSGTEAVEAAIKMARSRTKRKGILATKGGFHGKTLGSLSATGRDSYQTPFFAPVEGFGFVSFGDTDQLRKVFSEKGEQVAALILEPIQGEGGIVEPPRGYLKEAKKICEEHGALLILDEIQTGLGRTGHLFLGPEEEVTPDIITIAKALGGGLFPIGAVLATRDAFTDEFGNKHSSTFAGNTLGARVGLAVLDILTENDGQIMKEVQKKGARFKAGLQEIKEEFPRVIKEVRGRGFLLGMDFNVSRFNLPETLLGIMGDQDMITPVLSSHLLCQEKVRVAPTLNGDTVIRIEPPLTVSDEEIDYALQAIYRMARRLDRGNTAAILKHLTINQSVSPQAIKARPLRKPLNPKPDEGRWAFIAHPLDIENYRDFDRSLKGLKDEDIKELTGRWNDLVEPFLVSEARIETGNGQSAMGDFIIVPRTAEELMAMPGEEALEEVRRGVEMARERGAKIVGLGAYTSVVSRGGLHLRKAGVPVTTGNSYTVVSAVNAVEKVSEKINLPLSQARVSVVGATGAIGGAASLLLAGRVGCLDLIGNPRHPEKAYKRLLKGSARIYRYLVQRLRNGEEFAEGSLGCWLSQQNNMPGPAAPLSRFVQWAEEIHSQGKAPVKLSSSCPDCLPGSDITVIATSSLGEFITADMLKKGAVVLDLSRPPNVSREVEKTRPDVLVIDGGVIKVPGEPDWGWNFGFEQGLAYACMSETFILGLEKEYRNMSLGTDLNLKDMNYIQEKADKHGFKLAGFRSFDRPLSEKKWENFKNFRLKKISV